MAWFKTYFQGFRVQKAVNVTPTERAVFERHGEYVIREVLIGNISPQFLPDMVDVFQNPDIKQHLAEWLIECATIRHRHDRWIETRDFALEISVIVLIGVEIILSFQQEKQQSANFEKQQAVLTNLGKSSQATADVLTSLKTTMEAMNASVTRSAKAAEESAATASKSLHVSERAYIGGTMRMKAPPKAGEKPQIVVELRSSGKSSAMRVTCLFRLTGLPKGQMPEQIKAAEGSQMPMSMSTMDSGVALQGIAGSPPLSEQDVLNVENGSVVIYGLARVWYTDLLNEKHEENICTYYEPQSGQMILCPILNFSK